MWHKTQRTENLFNKKKFTPYPVPPAHVPASVLGPFSDAMNPKCQLEADTSPDTKKRGIDNLYGIQCSLLSPTYWGSQLVCP
jgi:hypothetical protein